MTGASGVEPWAGRWKALGVSLAAGFMGLLDVSIVNVALPSIQESLNASASAVQWVVSGYALTFGLVLVAGGRLGDLLGRRRMFLIALSGFVLTSALAGAAPSPTVLVVARLLQGIAAGMLTPQNSGLIQDLFTGAERGKAFGYFGAMAGLATAIGPVLGGGILAVADSIGGWRWVFFVNVPVGVVALVFVARLLPRAPHRDGRRIRSEIDVVGMVLLGLAVFSLLLPVVRSEGGGLAALWWLFPLSACCVVAFVWWENRMVRMARAPLLNTKLFTSTRGFASGTAIGTMYFCGFTGIWLVFAIFFQQGLGYTALQSGLAVTPFAVGGAVSSILAGRVVQRFGRWLTIVGTSLVAAGLAGVAVIVLFVPPELAGFAVAGPLLVAGIGGGIVISPNTTLTLRCVPPGMGGVAGGALQTGQRIGTAIGTAVLAAVFRAVVTSGEQGYPPALAAALGCAVVFTAVALCLAVIELRSGIRRRAAEGVQPVVPDSSFE